MNVIPNEEQEQIVSSVSALLKSAYPLKRLHQTEEVGNDTASWKKLAEYGLFAVAIPESEGGVGYSLAEQSLIFREAGRMLAPVTILPTSLAAEMAATFGQSDLAHGIMDGREIVGLGVACEGTEVSIGKTVSGKFRLFTGIDPTYFLLSSGAHAAIVPATAFSSRTDLPCLDQDVHMGIAEIENVETTVFNEQEDNAVHARGAVLTAAMQVGIAQAALEMTVEHAKIREQFGAPIGSFQAVRHPCADTALKCEVASAQSVFASLAYEEKEPDADFLVSAAKVLASTAALSACQTCIQVHGGIGMTDEHDAHLYLKRTHLLDFWFETPDRHLEIALAL